SDWLMNKALQDLQAGRDPFAASRHEVSPLHAEPPPPFCFRAAKLSLWLPIIASALATGIKNALDGHFGMVAMCIRLASLGVFSLLIVASLIFSVIGLTGVKEHGSAGLLWRGIRGVVANMVTIYILITSGIDAYHARVRARSEALAQQQEQQAEEQAERAE